MNVDRRNSVYGRLSLSTTNITTPIAESTHLNGSRIKSKFPWGGKLFSPPKSPGQSSPPVLFKTTMSPINKIDQRVYVDVQSRGLASRIVRYHENGSKLNRSLSMGNIYNKPGQFPIVHLKKKEIVYKPSRNQNISMVKIAAPGKQSFNKRLAIMTGNIPVDKSVFQANTRSSILRTGSIVPTVGLPRSDDEVSRENRPILHPVGSELAPTKSVLDALREISRKRINNDVSVRGSTVRNKFYHSLPLQEVDTNDSGKKYCKESDDADRGVHLLPTFTISKRQREGPSCLTSNASVSPEQMSKKRMYFKNNDVLSSLSSSQRMETPKRKFDDIRAPKSSEKVIASDASTSPQLKQQCNETNFVSFQKLDSVLESQITPLPPTPAVELPNLKDIPEFCPEVVKEKSKVKLTLFNAKYDEESTKIRTEFDSNLDDFGSGGVIPFVKPKNNTQISEPNPIIERTKKSKLTLMLSGLSGELSESDITDSPSAATIEENSVSSSQISLPVVVTVSPASISFETKTTTVTATIPTVSSTKIVSNNENSARTSMSVSETIGKQDVSRGYVPSAQSSIPLSLPNSVKTTTSGFSFPSQVSNSQTTATSSTSNPASSSTIVNSLTFSTSVAKPTSGSSDSPLGLKSITSAPVLIQPQFSFGTKPVASAVESLPAFSVASSQNATKISFGVPDPIAPAVSAPLKISTSSTLAPQSTGSEMKQVFGVSPNNQSAFSGVAPTEGPKTSQPLNFSATQSAAATTNITTSLFSAPSTSLPTNTKPLFGVPNLGTVKTDSQNIENKSSHGFSFASLNPGGDSKGNTTPFAFSSNPSPKPAGAGSGVFSFSTSNTSAPAFGIPSTSTQSTTAPAFGVPSTTNPTSSSGSTGMLFSFSTNNGKPSTGFTLAGTAGENNQQTANSVPFSFGSTPKPQPAPTSNALLNNPAGQEKSNPFSFGAPNPQQKPAAGSSIFGGVSSDGKAFSFAGGDQKAPASTNNIFETASNSFATPAPTTALNFAFTPQTTANSIFGAPTTTTSNSFRMPQTTASSVFGAPPESAAPPAFGVTTAPASSSIFGQASNSSAFGAPKTTANSVFAPRMPENKPAAPLAFGVPVSSSNNTTANTKTFSFSANNSTPAGGFSFSTAAANPPSKGGISAVPTTAPSNSFNFRQGQSVNNNAVFGGSPVTNSTNAPSVFGTPSVNQPKTFNFSAGSNSPASSNPFRGVPAENKTDNTFNFGATPQQPPNTGSNSKPFTFGGSSASSAFAFNTTPLSTAAPAPAANKIFNFGGSPTQSANQPNNSSAAQFSFTSGTNGPAAAATTQASIFSPGQASTPSATTNTTRDRVIRIATRRLNK